MFDPSAGPQGPGPIFCDVACPIHVFNSKLKSFEVCACRYVQWGSTGSGTQITVFESKIMHLQLILGHFGFLTFSSSIAMSCTDCI